MPRSTTARISAFKCPPGDFVDAQGNVLGRHKGIIHYTLGQRRGLGIPAAHRCYVTKIDPETNTVTLGTNDDLMKRTLYAGKVNLITVDRIDSPSNLMSLSAPSRPGSPSSSTTGMS